MPALDHSPDELNTMRVAREGGMVSTQRLNMDFASLKSTPSIVEVSRLEFLKGVGEIPSINTTPAICNAIYNATGVRIYSIPVDQDALLLAIKRGQREVRTAWHDVK